jgi:poly-gamma-glutamate synthesis protein (capsule biosynthesis protein)
VRSIVQQSDFSIINLEYPVTFHSKKIVKYGPAAKSNPKCLKALSDFDAVTLGTNHSADFGNKGIEDTLRYCKDEGLQTVGVGMNAIDALQPLRINIREKRISILNFAETQFNTADSLRGGANPFDIISNVKSIREEREESDFVLVMIHGGPDLCQYPSPDLVKRARFYAEEGASAIILHHSRVVSPFEVYKNVPIFYGLGNFIHFTKEPDLKEQIGLTIQLELKDSGIDFTLFPVQLDMATCKLSLITGNKKQALLSEIEDLNLRLLNLDELKVYWGNHIRQHSELRYLVLLSGIPNTVFKVFRKLNALTFLKKILLVRKNRFLPILNFLQNESHNESAKYILNEIFKKNREPSSNSSI